MRSSQATTDWSMPPIRRATREAMRDLLDAPPPEDGIGASEALDRLLGDVVPHLARLDHPRYFAFIPCSGTWPGAIGDLVASALSVYATSWLEGAGPTQLELTVLDWFKDMDRIPRRRRRPADERRVDRESPGARLRTRAPRRRDARRPDRVRLGSGALVDRTRGPRPRLHAQPGARAADRSRPSASSPSSSLRRSTRTRARGLTPLLASVSAGATNTGAVDPLRDLAETCRERDVWLHVDAAYGGFAALVDRGRDAPRRDRPGRLRDARPAQAALPVVRVRRAPRPRAGRAALRVRDRPALPPRHARPGGRGQPRRPRNPAEQDEPRLQGLAVGADLRPRGVPAGDRPLVRPRRARRATHRARATSSSSSRRQSLGIVCFRRRPTGVDDEVELAATERRARGRARGRAATAFVSSTTLRGRYAIRLCPMNHVTEQEDVDRALDFLERTRTRAAPRPGARADRDVELARSWLRQRVGRVRETVDPRVVRSIAMLSDLSDDDATRVAAIATTLTVPTGRSSFASGTSHATSSSFSTGEVSVARDGAAGRHAPGRGLLR